MAGCTTYTLAGGQDDLFDACAYGRTDMVRKCLKAGDDPKQSDFMKRTPLHYAAGFSKQIYLTLYRIEYTGMM